MKRLRSYLWEHKGRYAIALACMIAAIGLDMLYPVVTGKIVDDVIGKGKTELLFGLLATVFFCGVGRSVFGYWKEYLFDTTGFQISADLRRDLFGYIQRLSADFFDRTSTGELMARVKDDVDRIGGVTGFVGMLLIEVFLHVSIVLFCMFRLSPVMAILPCVVAPMVGFLAVFMERRLHHIYEEISEENAELTRVAEENLAGVRTVKAFAREDFEIGKFKSHNKRYYDLNISQSKVLVKYQPYFQFVSKLLPFVVIVIGGVQVIHGAMTLGTLIAFTEYSRNIVWPMEMLGWLTNDFSAALASQRKIRTIFEETPELTEPKKPVVLDKIRGEIEFSHVSFEKSGVKILEDISFHLEPGKTLGIMGATGAGKSSIVHLFQRFYDVNQGAILLDGVDIRKLGFQQLRESASLVMQDVFLFSDTIEENIKMGLRASMTPEAIREAARFSKAQDFIERMEEQYGTVIGERGVGLSGGQKQRISIARAVAKHRPVLILDDSTSALDMETEHEIQKELSVLDNVTKMIIAHRISAVCHADEILVLDQGRIAERGTHNELLAKKGLYYETYMAQYGESIQALKEMGMKEEPVWQ